VEVGEPTGIAEKTYRPGQPAAVTVTPPADVNRVGEQHCVTATVVDEFGNPVEEGVLVVFEVTGANDAEGADRTDDLGQAEFCYTGTVAGVDAITATADGDEDGTVEADEPSGAAEKTYRPGQPVTVEVEPAAATNAAGEEHCVTATVRDEFGNAVEAGITVEFTVTGANPRGPTIDETDENGVAEFCYTGTVAGVDAITATADGDEDGTVEEGEPTGAAEKTYVPAEPARLTLSPKAATNTVGTEHCVTATVTDAFGNATPGITVEFTVTGAVMTSGTAGTDAEGDATFCYDGPILPGEDAIHAYADTDEDGTQDLGEPFDEATKSWVLPPSTAFCEVVITNGGWIIANNGDKGSFGGNARADAEGNVSGQQLYQDHGPAQPMTVKSVEILALTCSEDRTQADIYGRATIDGEGSYLFRIRVRDLAEPGKRRDTYRITVSNGYESGDHLLRGGNIQIH
ncbi:MAG: Ig-like domain-containing protein, partial [Chloroflexi bacterium]|nr:Ig-like domain-containing protein [Chloroflexota bacterium]